MRSHEKRRCSILGPIQNRISPSILQYTQNLATQIIAQVGHTSDIEACVWRVSFPNSEKKKTPTDDMMVGRPGGSEIEGCEPRPDEVSVIQSQKPPGGVGVVVAL